jgi:circadian clock protein KaiC
MASIGYDLSEAMASGVLRVLALRSGTAGPERHMIEILAAVDELEASIVVIDPISAFNSGDHPFADLMTHHLFHELDRRGVTTVCTSLVSGTVSDEATKSQISTIADNWLHVTYLAHGGERNRALTVVKARGTANSNQVRELVISSEGVALLPVFLSGGDVLVGAARAQHEERERREEWERAVAFEQRRAAAQNDVDDLVADLGRLERELTARRDALADLDSLRQQELARDVSERAERKRTRSANMTGVS